MFFFKKNKNHAFFENKKNFSKAVSACLSEDWLSIPGIKKDKINNNLWESNSKIAQGWLTSICNQADKERDNQNWAAAALLYEAACYIAPWRIDLKIQMGNMVKDSGFLEKAEKIYCSIIEKFPEEPEPHVQLGHVYKISGQRQSAINCYRRALSLNPKYESAYKELYLIGETDIQENALVQQNIFLGLEKTLEISSDIKNIKDSIENISKEIPNVKCLNSIPKDRYDLFKKIFSIPRPEIFNDSSITFILKQNDISSKILFQQIGYFSQLNCDFFIVIVDATDQVKESWNRSFNFLNRILYVDHKYDFSQLPRTDIIVLFDSKCTPHYLFIPWILAAFKENADIVYCDQEIIQKEQTTIIARPNVDNIWINQINIIGDTIAISWNKWKKFPTINVDLFIDYLIKNFTEFNISHVPYPLLSSIYKIEHNIDSIGKLPSNFTKNSKQQSFSVLICTKNNSKDCLSMIDSINAKSSGKNKIEILVISNNTDNINDLENLKKIKSIKNAKIYFNNEPFNWSNLNNTLSRSANNETLLFCNDDMEILTDNWDEILAQIINDSSTGIVGTKLIYRNNTIQHGGILFGWNNSVIHDGLFENKNSFEQFARWQCTRKVSAVTGAFLAIKKDLFFELKGFDDKEMPISYSDIDLCLKVREKNLSIIWTPLIEVRHDESVSRGLDHLDRFKAERCSAERLALEKRWGVETFSTDFSVNPIWLDATRPFRLLSPISLEKAINYIKPYKL